MIRRLVYLSHASVPSSQANSLQVMKMCEAFARRCDEVVLFCRDGGGDAAVSPHAHYGVDASFELVPLRAPRVRWLGRSLFSLRAALRLRRERRGGLVFARDYHTLALATLLGAARAPLVLEVHQPPAGRLQRRLLARVFRCPGFLRLVAISDALAREYRRLFGTLLDGRIVVAHDGADPPPPGGAEPAPRGGPLRLGYVGNLYPGKGMELIERLAERLDDHEFVVVGGEPDDVARWRRRLPGAHVTFTGHLPHPAAQARMRSCDVLLAPFQRTVLIGGGAADISRWMSPLKVFEYLASGRPMVASDLPVLREVLRDGENALLADPADPEAWIERIRRLADPGLRRAIAARAREDLAREHTWDRRAEAVLGGLDGARVEATRTGS